MLCLTHTVRLEAEFAGSVVLNANRSKRVIKVTGTGVELVGLNITGGEAQAGGGILIGDSGSAALNLCNIFENIALEEGGGIFINGSSAALDECNIFRNKAFAQGWVSLAF